MGRMIIEFPFYTWSFLGESAQTYAPLECSTLYPRTGKACLIEVLRDLLRCVKGVYPIYEWPGHDDLFRREKVYCTAGGAKRVEAWPAGFHCPVMVSFWSYTQPFSKE